jgi:hypothetical protein
MVDLAQNGAPSACGASISTYILALIAMTLRFTARHISKSRLWLDDWLVLGSITQCTAVIACSIQSLRLGVGRHVQALDPSVSLGIRIMFYVIEILFIWAVTLPKYSVLAFYWRKFAVFPIATRSLL